MTWTSARPSPHVGRPRQHPLDLDRDPVAADDHGTLGDGEVIGQYPDLVVLAGIELDHGAAAEAEHLVHRHGGRAEHDRDIELDLVEGGHGFPVRKSTLDMTTGW